MILIAQGNEARFGAGRLENELGVNASELKAVDIDRQDYVSAMKDLPAYAVALAMIDYAYAHVSGLVPDKPALSVFAAIDDKGLQCEFLCHVAYLTLAMVNYALDCPAALPMDTIDSWLELNFPEGN
jgi:hypothetical protein